MSEETDKPLKILVSGDVEGKLGDLYGKVRSIQQKAGKFDLLICVGEFFAENEKDNEEIDKHIADPNSIPILTYILGTNRTSRLKYFTNPDGYELCKDKILYLGPKGLFTTTQGLTIAYLSGFEEKTDNKKIKRSANDDASSDKDKEEEFITFNLKDIETLENNCERRSFNDCIDILFTNQWPKYIEKISNQPLENNQNSAKFGSELVSYLAMAIRPRYHFSATQNIFYERVPYRNHKVLAEKDKPLSKFLALSKVNKPNKPKYLYAFNITPSKKMSYADLVRNPGGIVTDCPYTDNLTINVNTSNKKPNDDEQSSSLQYFYDADHIKKMNEINDKAQRDKKRKLEAAQARENEPCWFCLGGSKVERHLIVSVGDKSYLAYGKGPLNKDHLLIIPIDHVQCSVQADEKLLEDINKYKIALSKYFMAMNKCVVFYERNFRTKHMQIQVYGLKADKAYLLKDAFMSQSKEQGVYLDEIPQFTNLKQVFKPNQSYFYLELPNEDAESTNSDKLENTRYLCEIRGNFPINFGRDVIASELLLNAPEKIDWKECVKTQEEEKEMSVAFRNNFKKFDPFL